VGRYLHFLDDDDLLQPDALATLSRALDTQPKAGMAGAVGSAAGGLRESLSGSAVSFRLAIILTF